MLFIIDTILGNLNHIMIGMIMILCLMLFNYFMMAAFGADYTELATISANIDEWLSASYFRGV